MALYSSSGLIASKPPRTIITTDSRAGCPGAAGAGPYGGSTTLMSQTITVSSTALVWSHCRIIFNYLGRCDMYLAIDNIARSEIGALQYVNDNGSTYQWDEQNLMWVYTLSAGTHYLELRSATGGTCDSRFGCGGDWGEISTIVWEQ
jgi:hypothetical protein